MISPILANVFLHYVLDEWFAEQVQPRLRGPSTLVRYCDDFVMLFAHKDDAERVLAVLGKRLGKFGLQLHPDKTRLVDFRYWKPHTTHKREIDWTISPVADQSPKSACDPGDGRWRHSNLVVDRGNMVRVFNRLTGTG